MFFQRTIQKRAHVSGCGLHTGKPVQLTFCPAPPNIGIYFVRKDLKGKPAISTQAESVHGTTMATTLGEGLFSVATVEHCLSVLAAFRIDNLFIELDGPEIPIGDGSARCFLQAILEAGIVDQDQPRKYAYVDQLIYYGNGEKYAYVTPYNGLRVTCTIDFPHPQIGKQTLDLDINERTFTAELAHARTFGFLKDIEALHAKGMAKGGSLNNAVVLDEKNVLNPEGLRFKDEFVRHKMLDALGDLVTLGRPLMGHLVLYKPGHQLMNRLVRTIIDSPSTYRDIELGEMHSDKAQLPLSAIIL